MAQKGGVGKSSVCRAMAVAGMADSLSVHIADLNDKQQTCYEWAHRRRTLGAKPDVPVDVYPGPEQAMIGAGAVDLLIIDAPGETNPNFLDIARAADCIVQPMRPRLDDINPAIRLFHELSKAGIAHSKLALLFYCVESEASERDMRAYVAQAGYAVLAASIEHMETYGKALDVGKSLVETPLPHLNVAAHRVCHEILALMKHARPTLVADKKSAKLSKAAG
jgi:chromosome partitioning protein